MDTRTKIVTLDGLAAMNPARPLLMAVGRFDILRVEAVRALADARRLAGANSLLVAIRPLSGELAPSQARAELAAALRVVDYVFVAEDGDLRSFTTALQPDEIIDLEEADAHRTRQLIEHVHCRQTA